MSLRARLLLGLIALTAAGLITAGVITYAAERSFLVSRVDQEFNPIAINSFEDLLDQKLGLVRANPPAAGGGLFGNGAGGPGGGPLFGNPGVGPGGPTHAAAPEVLPPVGTYGVHLTTTGKVTAYEFAGQYEARPSLPKSYPISTSDKHPRLFTTGSTPSGVQYRVLAKRSDTGSGVTLIAVPLSDVNGTLIRLRNIELIVIASILAALAASAWLLIHLGLRPLDRIGETAGAIAAGDLSRRVSPASSRTEIGRLGLALNAMLGQIEEAFEERQESEDRLRRFLSDASHELRTPLTSIRGYAELYRMGAARDAQDTARAMARIEEEATRMGVLVEDLLALARLDEMPQTHRERLDLEPLLQDAAADARVAAPDREVTVAVAGLHTAQGDASQLRQVLANLLRNALTHTPAGSPIELSIADSDGYVRVVVRDHGPGLPDSAGANVFERFWRAERGRERGKAGAGLGLAIVAAIVDAHDGRLSATNAPGGGAEFAFEIPAAPERPSQ